MGITTQTGLQRRVELLRQSSDYKLLFESAIIALSQRQEISSIVDEVLRPIARDLSTLRAGNVILHIYIVPPGV